MIPDLRGTLPYVVVVLALGSDACAAGPERREHLVLPLHTGETSEGFPAAPTDTQLACPMAVEGVDVLVVPIDGGTALVFTTPLASPAEVRRHAWYFAASYDADRSTRPGLQRPEVSPAGFPTSARYSEVAAGARVEIRPVSDVNLSALRVHLSQRANHMQMTQSC